MFICIRSVCTYQGEVEMHKLIEFETIATRDMYIIQW